jgi:hypothetical protein
MVAVRTEVVDTVSNINLTYMLGLRDMAREDPCAAAYVFGMSRADVDEIVKMSTERLIAFVRGYDAALVQLRLGVKEMSELLKPAPEIIAVLAAARNSTIAHVR